LQNGGRGGSGWLIKSDGATLVPNLSVRQRIITPAIAIAIAIQSHNHSQFTITSTHDSPSHKHNHNRNDIHNYHYPIITKITWRRSPPAFNHTHCHNRITTGNLESDVFESQSQPQPQSGVFGTVALAVVYWNLRSTHGIKLEGNDWQALDLMDFATNVDNPFDTKGLYYATLDGGCRHSFTSMELKFYQSDATSNLICQW
jgi:hypothetical protein